MREIFTEQIKHGFEDRYYLHADGRVYDESKDKYITADKYHKFHLKTKQGTTKTISLKTLYKLVYHTNYCVDNIEDLTGEDWEAIEDTNELYWVSNKGRVKSYSDYEAILLKPFLNQSGYARVDIHYGNIRKTKLVHVLVANAFLGKPQTIEQICHHINGNKLENFVENLEYLSPIEHAKKHAERRANNND